MGAILDKFPYTDKKDTRSGFGAGMAELADTNPDVVAMCADLVGSLKLQDFIAKQPGRFIQCGIAEANMIGMAAGLATVGKIPYATTFANFATGRVYDQIRQSVAYSHKNVKICASHAGLTLGEDGATHQILEDVGMMRMLPEMTVITTCDYNQTKAATIAVAAWEGPVYLRFGRPVMPVFMPADRPFEIGKADVLHEGSDVTIIASGHLVWEALKAADTLLEESINATVINLHTIKPFDEQTVLDAVRATGCVVVAEEHQMNGGLTDAVAQLLARTYPLPLEAVAVHDSFGESGTPDQLLDKYGLKDRDIAAAVKRVILRK